MESCSACCSDGGGGDEVDIFSVGLGRGEEVVLDLL